MVSDKNNCQTFLHRFMLNLFSGGGHPLFPIDTTIKIEFCKVPYNNYSCTMFGIKKNSNFREKIFFIFPCDPIAYDKTLSCNAHHLGFLIDKNKLLKRPYKEHSYKGTIPSHMRFLIRRFLKFKPIIKNHWP